MKRDYWQSALEGKADDSKMVVGIAECGYWRKGNRDGTYTPIAIWDDSEYGRVAKVGNTVVLADAAFCENTFSWAMNNPVSYDAYEQFMTTGKWLDEAPDRPVLSNFPTDPFEQLKLELESEKDEVERFLKNPITTQELADRAASWANRLSDNGKKAEKICTEEKQPFLEGGRVVDAKWKPIPDGYSLLTRKLKDAITPFLREKQRKAKEEAEAAAKAVRASTFNAPLEPVKPAEKIKAGNFGRSTSLRTFKQAKIVDQDALYQAIKDNPSLKEVMQGIAQRAVAGGGSLPGVEVEEIQKAV